MNLSWTKIFLALIVCFSINIECLATESSSTWISWIEETFTRENYNKIGNAVLIKGVEMQQTLGTWLQEIASQTNKPKKTEAKSFEQNIESEEPSGFSATFVNESPFRVSVFWDNDEELHRVVNVLNTGEESKINTFDGHIFLFTREGTRDVLHEPFVMSSSQDRYVLPENAVVDDNPCKDRYKKRCVSWAEEGECQKNPGWMIVNCPSACESCELLDPGKRCDPDFLNISADSFWEPGHLDEMFERILSDKFLVEEYGISVVKGPPEDAWLLQFDKFMTSEEVDVLVEWGNKLGFERSTDTGKPNNRGEVTKIFSTGRTSSNAWCTNACENDPVVKRVSDRIVNITHVPYENYEQFQLLQYELGQKYNVHHDMSPKTDKRAGGVRILTFFLYLSDVEEGGETDFPRMNVKVKPKKGRAVLWPSVLNDAPMQQDPRTHHAALPVVKGLKYAANHWIHSHNFKKANKWGCTGSFD